MKRFILTLLLTFGFMPAAFAARMRLTVPEEAPIGQPFFLEMRANEAIGDVTVKWRGQQFILTPRRDTIRTILGVPNDAKLIGSALPVLVEFDCGAKGRVRAERKIKVVGYRYPKQVLKVAPKMVTPPQSELKRIAKERRLVQKALATRSKGGVLPRRYVRPVPGIPTAYFGGFRVYNGVPRSGHGGLDLRAAVGTPVRAIADGVVVLEGHHYFSGGAVYVDHGGGVLSVYFHLSKILVGPGQKVKAGDTIALSGATGRVTGPHLHLGLFSGGMALDPLPLLDASKMPKGAEVLYEF